MPYAETASRFDRTHGDEDFVSNADLRRARESIVDDLMDGERVFGVCLADLLDGHSSHECINLLLKASRQEEGAAIELRDYLTKLATDYAGSHEDEVAGRAIELREEA